MSNKTTKPDESFEIKVKEAAEHNLTYRYSNTGTFQAKPEFISFMAGAKLGRAIGLEEGRSKQHWMNHYAEQDKRIVELEHENLCLKHELNIAINRAHDAEYAVNNFPVF